MASTTIHNDFMNLKEESALICGASDGIGKAIAKGFIEHGACVTLLARNEEKLRAICNELGDKAKFLVADFNDPQGVQSVVAQHLSDNQNFDILINNTGGPTPGMLLDAEITDFEMALRMHLHCSHLLVQLLVPKMKLKGHGRIINIISTSIRQPIEGIGVSNTTRGAMASWAKTLSNELGPYGITVNNILPGSIETKRLNSLMESKAIKTNKTFDQIQAESIETIPLRRIGSPEDMANAALFLASEKASYITGVSLPVDGGRLQCI